MHSSGVTYGTFCASDADFPKQATRSVDLMSQAGSRQQTRKKTNKIEGQNSMEKLNHFHCLFVTHFPREEITRAEDCTTELCVISTSIGEGRGHTVEASHLAPGKGFEIMEVRNS